MTVLITGATGFVGTALTRRLLYSSERVVCLVRDGDVTPGAEVIRGELEDLRTCERAIAEYRPDVVYHLAAQAIVGTARRDPLGTLETNVRGTYNLLEAHRRYGDLDSAFIMASSDKAYGELPVSRQSYGEGDPLEGRGPYDVSKSCADLIAQSYAITYGLNVGIVRAGNIYGPGDKDLTRIVPSIVNDLQRGVSPVIMSDGTPVRDYLYVDDAVNAYLDLAKFKGKVHGLHVFNFSGGEPVSVRALVDMMGEVTGIKVEPLVLGVRRGEISRQVLDSSNARLSLGWLPSFRLRQGLHMTWLKRRGGVKL